ncbi:hypothetical protein BN903_176 [Halorubrum sp. AJ67]|nr:hypothetical protein BN903_176 [Halorubrum sp. AJ67]
MRGGDLIEYSRVSSGVVRSDRFPLDVDCVDRSDRSEPNRHRIRLCPTHACYSLSVILVLSPPPKQSRFRDNCSSAVQIGDYTRR